MSTVAFIGLGTMGFPMAGHLARAGHQLRVYNRTGAVADRWTVAHGTAGAGGHRRAASPAEAAADADLVFLCVGADADVRAVTTGPGGALGTMRAGSVLVDHTTASADVAREIGAACAARGVGFVDAPVSGGQAGAENGQLSVMCGGAVEHVDAARPVLAAYAKAVTHLGPVGNGQLTKMVNQILCAAAIHGAAEALAFGERAGLDMANVLAAVTKGAANSWYLENRGPTMLTDEFAFGFAVDWMKKDLGLCLTEAAAIGADVPLTALVDAELAAMQARGANRLDATSIIRLFRGEPGPEVRRDA